MGNRYLITRISMKENGKNILLMAKGNTRSGSIKHMKETLFKVNTME